MKVTQFLVLIRLLHFMNENDVTIYGENFTKLLAHINTILYLQDVVAQIRRKSLLENQQGS